jgi:hypothetical protein
VPVRVEAIGMIVPQDVRCIVQRGMGELTQRSDDPDRLCSY